MKLPAVSILVWALASSSSLADNNDQQQQNKVNLPKDKKEEEDDKDDHNTNNGHWKVGGANAHETTTTPYEKVLTQDLPSKFHRQRAAKNTHESPTPTDHSLWNVHRLHHHNGLVFHPHANTADSGTLGNAAASSVPHPAASGGAFWDVEIAPDGNVMIDDDHARAQSRQRARLELARKLKNNKNVKDRQQIKAMKEDNNDKMPKTLKEDDKDKKNDKIPKTMKEDGKDKKNDKMPKAVKADEDDESIPEDDAEDDADDGDATNNGGTSGNSSLCFHGNASYITAACQALQAKYDLAPTNITTCCTGEDACNWPDDQHNITVCRRACAGKRSCSNLASGTYVGVGGCIGDKACYNLGAGTYIRRNACYGKEACMNLAKESKSANARIGPGACVGVKACKYLCEASVGCHLYLGANSCGRYYDYESCYGLGRNSVENVSISIGDYACSGHQACRKMGLYNGTQIYVGKRSCYDDSGDPGGCSGAGTYAVSVSIGSASCIGEMACVQVGEFANTISIADSSCFAVPDEEGGTYFPFRYRQACYRLGSKALGSIIVSGTSCIGGFACSRLGSHSMNNVLVGFGSCTAIGACFDLGYNTTSSVHVGNGSCTDFSCRSLGSYSSGEVIVGHGSCTAKEACDEMGQRTRRGTLVGNGSCIDLYACQYLGEEAVDYVAVGDDSCTGPYSCRDVGGGPLAGYIKLGDRSCIGSQACYELGDGNSPGINISVGTGSCLMARSCLKLGRAEQIIHRVSTIEIQDNACTGLLSCYQFGSQLENANILVLSTFCTGDTECAGSSLYNDACTTTAMVPNGGGLCPR